MTAVEPLPTTPETALEVQREFLLDSIADLDAERASGELSDKRHRELRDGYTVQAATVLRAIERLRAGTAVPEARQLRRGPRPLVVAAVATILVALGGLLLSRSLMDRQPGQTITGNAQSTSPQLAELERAADQRPNDAKAQLDYAHALLEADQAVDALRAFDTAARLDPADPVARAYGGWVVFLAGLTDEAISRLDAAVSADPAYPDARFFRGMALLRGRDDRVGALVELRAYLRLTSPGPERDRVQALVAELEQGATPTTTEVAK